MNFRKIVSALSALAIIASAFVGLAVTANAEDSDTTTTQTVMTYYVGSADGAETFDNYTGSVFTADGTVGDNNTFSGVTPFSGGGDKPAAVGDKIESVESGTYPVYVSGNVWMDQIRGKSTRTSVYYLTDSAITKGTVHISTDIAFSQNGDSVLRSKNFCVLDSNGKAVLTFTYTGGDTNSSLTVAGKDDVKILNGTLPRRGVTPIGFHIDADIDLDSETKTAKVAVDYVDAKAYVDDNTPNSTYLTRISTGTQTVTLSNEINDVNSISLYEEGNSSSNHRISLDNTLIYNEYEDDGTVAYKVNYIDESGNTLKSSVTYYGQPNSSISLTTNDKAVIRKNGIKYIYKSDNASEKTISSDGTTEVNVVFRTADTYNYTVVSNLGTTIAAGSGFEGDSVKIPYSKYLLKDNTMYSAKTNGSEYNYSMTLTENNKVGTITYTKDDTISNPVFLVEGENIKGATASADNYANIRASNSAMGFASQDIILTALKPGKYKITAVLFTRSGNATIPLTVGSNSFTLTAGKSSYLTDVTTDEFAIDKTTDVVWNASTGTSKAGRGIDFLYIEKTGDVTYGITAETPTNGELTVATEATPGDAVTVTATADEGYEVSGITVTDADSNTVDVTANTDGTYSFTMPASAVTVTAVIEAAKPSAAFDTKSDSRKESDNTYTVGFLSTVSNFTNADGWTVTDAGFVFANIDNANIKTESVSANGTDEAADLKDGESFRYIFKNIADSYTSFNIMAIPYIIFTKASDTSSKVTVWGEYVNGDNEAFSNTATEDGTTAE